MTADALAADATIRRHRSKQSDRKLKKTEPTPIDFMIQPISQASVSSTSSKCATSQSSSQVQQHEATNSPTAPSPGVLCLGLSTAGSLQLYWTGIVRGQP